MNPQEILQRAQEHTWARRYPEALADFLWFHHHALEHDYAFYGVRLSFALTYWQDLAEVYPPAGEAMRAVRAGGTRHPRRKGQYARTVRRCSGDRRQAGQDGNTYDLFVAFRSKWPELARSCVESALPSVVDEGDWTLASEIMDPPEGYLLAVSAQLNTNARRRPISREMASVERSAFVSIYCEDVVLLLRVLEGLGRVDERAAAEVWAVALVENANVRRLVARELGTLENRS